MQSNIRDLHVRIPKESLIFLKKTAVEQERTMGELINILITKYQNKFKKNIDE